MMEGDRVMSPKILCIGFCDAHRWPVLVCIQSRGIILAAATLSNAPNSFGRGYQVLAMTRRLIGGNVVSGLAEWYDCTPSCGRVYYLLVHCAREWVSVEGTP